MRPNLPDRFNAAPRKILAARPVPSFDRVAEREALGNLIARAFEILRLTKLQVAQELGYGENQAPISRQCSGLERPQVERFLAELPGFQTAFIKALAERSDDPCVQIEETITVRRRA